MVAGILSLLGCSMFAAIPAIVCGHIGVRQADRGEASGKGMEISGMTAHQARPRIFGCHTFARLHCRGGFIVDTMQQAERNLPPGESAFAMSEDT